MPYVFGTNLIVTLSTNENSVVFIWQLLADEAKADFVSGKGVLYTVFVFNRVFPHQLICLALCASNLYLSRFKLYI